ncbi:DUF4430 domain-containing protein [Olsenella sp. Marseille-P4559]|uniref:DUF4430 domain-containing protein n=1 Tax=Olsenella sp. Marseille-P4559 TaxID=2364795 RepID=UPI001030980A|nr:DUF4430 domain-containing protein [Olsenella sp. Marseille-P4559]
MTERDKEEVRMGAGRKTVRAVVAALAVVLVVFCVWAMSVYVQGGDPLAWANASGALRTTADETVQEASDSEQPAVGDATATTLTADDIIQALTSLSFDGKDVSLGKDDAKVVLSSEGIWVEEASSADAQDMVEKTSQRAAALSLWAASRGASLRVTWICEDGAGAVRMALAMAAGTTPTSGGTAQILSAAEGYRISGDAYAKLEDATIPQSAGTDPLLPDGTRISVEGGVTSGGENLSSQDVSSRQETVNSGTAATSGDTSSGRGSAGSGTSPTGSPSDSSASQDAKIHVSVTINASADGGSAQSYSVSLAPGSSAYDALLATGASVNARDTVYGTYVAAIDGYAEKDQGGASGWKYAVNGSYPGYSAANCTLSDGDTVTWVYVTSS